MKIISNPTKTFRLIRVIYLTILLSVYHSTNAQSWKIYPYSPQGSLIEFPRDEGYHPSESVEWWYANGHFTGEISGHQYSFMVSYFHRPAFIFDGFRIFQLTDETTGVSYSQTLPCNYPVLAVDSLHIYASFISGNPSEEWVNQVDSYGNMLPFEYELNASMSNAAINFKCSSNKPPLIINDNGLLNLGETNYSYYYSLTDLNLSGNLELDGQKEKISGIAWFDRQYGDFNPYQNESYEWFNVKLSDGIDLNIWNIFDEGNKIPDTKEYRICSALLNDTTFITTKQFKIKRLAYTYTPDSEKCYSSAWNITSDLLDLNLNCEAIIKNCEVNIQEIGMRFYEGSIHVSGSYKGSAVTGTGFAELVHSYEMPYLSIIQPVENDSWNNSGPLVWKVVNPDDGNPLKFDIDILTASNPIFKNEFWNLDDTLIFWNPGSFVEDSMLTVKVSGYSVDRTLLYTGNGVFKIQPQTTEFSPCIGSNYYFDLLLDPADYSFQWLLNGEDIKNASIPYLQINSVSLESQGNYVCIVSNEHFNDTTVEINLQPVTCTSIRNNLFNNLIVFPNPCDNYLMVNLPACVTDYLISIKNFNGTEVYESVIQNIENEIKTTKLDPGVYLLEIINLSEGNIQTCRFVKK